MSYARKSTQQSMQINQPQTSFKFQAKKLSLKTYQYITRLSSSASLNQSEGLVLSGLSLLSISRTITVGNRNTMNNILQLGKWSTTSQTAGKFFTRFSTTLNLRLICGKDWKNSPKKSAGNDQKLLVYIRVREWLQMIMS